jgi:hypothetical protein
LLDQGGNGPSRLTYTTTSNSGLGGETRRSDGKLVNAPLSRLSPGPLHGEVDRLLDEVVEHWHAVSAQREQYTSRT